MPGEVEDSPKCVVRTPAEGELHPRQANSPVLAHWTCASGHPAGRDGRDVGRRSALDPAHFLHSPAPVDLEVVIGRLLGSLVVLVVALVGCAGGPDLPDLDVATAAAAGEPPEGVLVDGGWPEVAAFVQESAAAGEGTVVNMFASWCAPCERELPLLLEVSRSTPGVRWLGVASEDRREHAEPFVERMGVTWPSVLDESASTHVALESLAMPTTAFFDAEGELRSIVVGELRAEQLESELQRIRP